MNRYILIPEDTIRVLPPEDGEAMPSFYTTQIQAINSKHRSILRKIINRKFTVNVFP